jgi:two-component system phosphate regulon sensor histidine kinase PhoR
MLIARVVLRDVGTLRSYAQTVAAGPEAHLPRLALPGTFQPVAVAIRRLGRAARNAQGAGASGEPALDLLPEPLILLDRDRRLLRANEAARELVGAAAVGRDLAAVLRNPVLLDAVDSVLQGGEAAAEAEFAFQVPVERHFSARIARIGDDAAPGQPAMVIALYELTAVKRTEQMRTDFIANVSHELRTPISVLLGCVQTLRGSARDDPEAQAEFFGLMEDQATRMSRLVDDLLSLSRIELNEHTTPAGAAEIGAIIGQVRDALSLKARERNMTIETDIPPDLPKVPGDKDDLVKVFQNLIDNAVKYGTEGSAVRVRARLVDDGIPPAMAGVKSCLAVSVEDRGDGIPPEHIPRLTERFYRVDTARSRQLGGTGLGLAIVKHVLNRHHGALTIESTPGKGSIFKVFLPAGGAAPEPARLPPPAASTAGEADG